MFREKMFDLDYKTLKKYLSNFEALKSINETLTIFINKILHMSSTALHATIDYDNHVF